jgi:hypothetical protein
MWKQIGEPDNVVWAFIPSKPWGWIQGTYTRPDPPGYYAPNEPELVAKGEMILAVSNKPGSNLWEHYSLEEDGFWWPCSGHEMGALLCDPAFVECINNMTLTLEHGPQATKPWKHVPRVEIEPMREVAPRMAQSYSVLDRPRRGGKQPKGRAWWNR